MSEIFADYDSTCRASLQTSRSSALRRLKAEEGEQRGEGSSEAQKRSSDHRIPIRTSRTSGIRMKSEKLLISFKNLKYTVNKGQKTVLDNIDGIFRPGRLTAIMGPSGAGKTSLLDVLAGNLLGGSVEGKIWVNGIELKGQQMKSISGFVFQDDVILETMTVREAIEMSALLRLPTSVSGEERKDRIDDLIQLLHLEECQNTQIGSPEQKGISGGERKRCSCAMELISNPPMLFLDEPTSGLDIFTAFTVIKSLKRLAKRGRTVIATVHQPSSEIFHLFDDLMLLANGRVAWCGSGAESIEYFGKIGFSCPRFANPADFYFMEILKDFDLDWDGNEMIENDGDNNSITSLAKSSLPLNSDQETFPNESESFLGNEQRIERVLSSWKESQEYAEMIHEINSIPPTGISTAAIRKMAPFWRQFKYLLGRASKNALRNPLLIGVQFIKNIYLGLIIGIVYINSSSYSVPVQIRNKSGALYFLALNVFFAGALGTLTVFYKEKQVFFREYKAAYYGTTAYYWSKFLVEVPYNFLFPYLLVIICYYMIGFDPAFSSYLMVATLAAVSSVSGVSLGVLISSIFSDLRVILAITPIIILPLLLFSGIFVAGDSLPVYFNWIKFISPIYYSFNGMLKVEFNRDFPNCDLNVRDCGGEQAEEILNLDNPFSSGINLLLGIVIWIVLTVSAYITLSLITRLKYKRQRNYEMETVR